MRHLWNSDPATKGRELPHPGKRSVAVVAAFCLSLAGCTQARRTGAHIQQAGDSVNDARKKVIMTYAEERRGMSRTDPTDRVIFDLMTVRETSACLQPTNYNPYKLASVSIKLLKDGRVRISNGQDPSLYFDDFDKYNEPLQASGAETRHVVITESKCPQAPDGSTVDLFPDFN